MTQEETKEKELNETEIQSDKTQTPEAENDVNQENDESVADEESADIRASRKERKKKNEKKCDELTARLEDVTSRLADMNDKYLRIYSEYENYRKRTSAEKADLILNGGKDVIKSMLPVIDDMERALDNMSDDDPAKEGMLLIYKNMVKTLQQRGLKPMEAKGEQFDENFHEAITQIPAPSPDAKGSVIDVVKKGYFLNDTVLRYAQVVVAN